MDFFRKAPGEPPMSSRALCFFGVGRDGLQIAGRPPCKLLGNGEMTESSDPQVVDLDGERGRNRTYNLLIKSRQLAKGQ